MRVVDLTRVRVTAMMACLCGILLMTAGCPPIEPCTSDADCAEGLICVEGTCQEPVGPDCTSNADCDDGLYCNGAETCTNDECQPGTNPCVVVGQTCNEETDTCELDPSLFETNALIDDFANVHPLHTTCTACHHEDPPAGFTSCTTCHSDDPANSNSFKEVAHDQNESGDGCRLCHDAEWEDNCAFCHTALLDL